MKSFFPVLAFVLALSIAVMVANQRRAWSPGLEGGSSSDSSTVAGHPSRHSRIERVAQSAREDGASAPGAPPASNTRVGEQGPETSAFDRIRVDEIAPNVYVVSAMDLLIALSQADAFTATIQPMLSFNTGPKYWIDSFVLEGVLGDQGFTVVTPRLMRRVGLEPGDTLRSVNGRSIDRDVDIQAILREVGKDPLNSVIRLEVERQGVKLTKTYQLG